MWEHRSHAGTIFGFSLYAVSLLVVLVIYFRTGLGDLAGGKPLEGVKMYYHQHQKLEY